MKNRINVIFKVLLVFSLTTLLSFSKILFIEADTERPDLEALCSATICFDSSAKEMMNQGKVSLYRIADLKWANGKIAFKYVSAYADCGIKTKCLENNDVADDIVRYTELHNILSEYDAEIVNGEADFVNIHSGLYLVLQSEKALGYNAFSPFVLPLPFFSEGGGYTYNVVSKPKISPEARGSSLKLSNMDSRLPQTGQLWWPVIVFSALGIFLSFLLIVVNKIIKERRLKFLLYLILSVISLALITLSAFLLTNNFLESEKAKQRSDAILKQLAVEENSLPQEKSDVKTVGKNSYIGILSIPAIQLYLPVTDAFEYKALKSSPCCYSGSVETNNLVIAGHNYMSHFGNLYKLKPQDEVIFFASSGQKIKYHVERIDILSSEEVQTMIDSDYNLSLFTCTLSGKKRITVRCVIER
ncbi:MAG: sortase [Clostridia bacterium]|nr:sortase [Clostridia bacterium]